MQQKATIGIIGGSGLYHMAGFESQEEILLETPFGQPSDAYIVGTLEGKSVAFLARHGRGHRIQPSDLNFRANIYGLKMLGVPPEWIGWLGAAMVLLGPLAWGFVRQAHGLPNFDNDLTAWRLPDRHPAPGDEKDTP